MREIKFRQRISGQWHYWGFFDREFIGPANPLDPNYQYTGLKDRRGREIYEGDILSWKSASKLYPSSDFIEERGEVKWDNKNACFSVGKSNFDFIVDSKIIGNIHDNPELLKKDK